MIQKTQKLSLCEIHLLGYWGSKTTARLYEQHPLTIIGAGAVFRENDYKIWLCNTTKKDCFTTMIMSNIIKKKQAGAEALRK